MAIAIAYRATVKKLHKCVLSSIFVLSVLSGIWLHSKVLSQVTKINESTKHVQVSYLAILL